ncbi:MAG: hypothetical protein AWU57_154 [Marinobacter sp. T13-3]|nr:MAG: hypothetical protein AWU57_154 [Marinobacter sp. T13-3]
MPCLFSTLIGKSTRLTRAYADKSERKADQQLKRLVECGM